MRGLVKAGGDTEDFWGRLESLLKEAAGESACPTTDSGLSWKFVGCRRKCLPHIETTGSGVGGG